MKKKTTTTISLLHTGNSLSKQLRVLVIVLAVITFKL